MTEMAGMVIAVVFGVVAMIDDCCGSHDAMAS